ncbi:MAG TPA: SPOR domain-containing protein [Candidatus Angelobacter sp.]|nr:SPOR domain-containing protein [Candidatus Angelobacter sp.]
MSAGTQMAEKESDRVQDKEITLSTGKLLGMFFALAIICGVFFTMGYLLGKSTTAGGHTEIVGSVPTGGSSAGKPSAANKTPETITQTCPPGSPDCAPATASTDAGSSNSSKTNDQQSASQPASGSKAPDQSASTGTEVKTGAGGSFMVQVAAVSKQEDADILRAALQKKQYPAFISSSTGDPLFHVQVGPYSDKKDADAMRARLANDGYNAIVK